MSDTKYPVTYVKGDVSRTVLNHKDEVKAKFEGFKPAPAGEIEKPEVEDVDDPAPDQTGQLEIGDIDVPPADAIESVDTQSVGRTSFLGGRR